MKKHLIALILGAMLPVQAVLATPPSQTVRTALPPAAAQVTSPPPENMQRELAQATALIQRHQNAQALPILNRLIAQADAEFRRQGNVRASSNRPHTLLLLAEAANRRQTVKVVSADWLLPRYFRAFTAVEQSNYAAAAADLDAVLEIAPYEPQFLSERGQVANGQKDFATSDRIFNRLSEAAKTLPDRAQSIFFQGMALHGQGYAAVERGQWQAAEQYYLQALRLNPNDQAAKNELDFVRQHRR